MSSKVARPDEIAELPPSMLVSATYDSVSKSALLKFYEPREQKIILWRDNTGHKPYCYSTLTPDEIRREIGGRRDIVDIRSVELFDLAEDRAITMSKIIAGDPLAIGGTPDSIRNRIETWESDIKYYENYLYDQRLIVGKHYTIHNSKVVAHDEDITEDVQMALKSLLWDKITNQEVVDPVQFQEFIGEWAHLLNQPIPEMRRVAVDIEVDAQEGRIPDPKIAEKRITAVGFAGTGGFKKMLVLDTGVQKGTNELADDVDIVFYDDEKKMVRDAFDIIADFPFVLTYNGDEFDLPYLYNRARALDVPGDENPLYMMKNAATLRRGVHIDLYRTMSNRSFQIYAFSQKYTNFSLDSVSHALLGERKIDYGKPLGSLTLYETANYCYNDARLTLKLTTFNGNLLMNLFVIIARIGRMPIDDISRMGVSQWIRSLLFYEHRRIGARIPGQKELSARTAEVTADAVIKDKKYRGGLVIEPVEGVHFAVTVVDFASLYPSIIKVKNISYETVRCPHAECRTNTIPQTNHWVCSKKNGITAMIIGSLRDLRVNYYKALSKSKSSTPEERQQYTVVTQALKVILNASYGVMGADIFPLYFLPAAEATTAVGRHTIQETIKICEKADIDVLYGDSVTGNTPVIIKKDGLVRIIPISRLYDPRLSGVQVWTDGGFTNVKHVYRHRVRKDIYHILTTTGYVECTGDHSLVINGRAVKPTDLKAGDRLNQFVCLPSAGASIVSPDRARRWGFDEGRGLGTGGARGSAPVDGNVMEIATKSCVVQIKMSDALDRGGVPAAVLNAGVAARRKYLAGLLEGLGWARDPTGAIEAGPEGYFLLQGVACIMNGLGLGYTLSRKDGTDTLQIRPAEGTKASEPDTVREIRIRQADEYVYDVETANHHFCGGIGNILLHNTDSLFLKNPTEDQIKVVVDAAKRDHGVELEVDKEYRYCVLSNRKKNYFGVTKSGMVDVKGLTGKKSHTPPFIKRLFEDVISILSGVQNAEEFERARKGISKRIDESGKRLEARNVPVKELAFNMTMSKSVDEYTKAIPQHVRAAKMLEAHEGRRLKRGEIISYVKTFTQPGAKPVSMANASEIDTPKYVEFMQSTLDQIVSSMGLDFDTIMGKGKQSGLDEFFWG